MLRRSLLTAAALVLVVSGCSSESATPPESTPEKPAAMLTPLIGSAVSEPIPTPATDGRIHLAYELTLSNTLDSDVTMTSLAAKSGDQTLATLNGDNLKYWTRAAGAAPAPTNVVKPGQSVTVWMDVMIENTGESPEVPTELDHTIDITVAKPIPGLLPATLTQPIPPVVVSTRKPVSISPPLDGPNWLNGDGCCDMSAHRTALNPINGKRYGAERYAIDYVQLTDDFKLLSGAATKAESYPYFGAAIHAVGDGKVVAVVDGLEEQTPTKSPTGLPLDQYGGNHVVQDLGDGNYAFYAHLQPGSITVKPGDDLSTGQDIAKLGNSGNSDAPHLHFHVMDGPDPLMSDGLPFVIKAFRLDQRMASNDSLDVLFTGKPAPLVRGFAARDESEVSPLDLDIMNYSAGQ
jgi:Peptidase family M23